MGEEFGSVEEILDFAIAREEEAHEFYMELSERVKDEKLKDVLGEFAIEELGHKMKLEAVKAGELRLRDDRVVTLDIAEYVEDVDVSNDMSLKEALVAAMKKEKAAYRLYNDLASESIAEEFTDMLLLLAQEEAKHKLRFELEYESLLDEEGN